MSTSEQPQSSDRPSSGEGATTGAEAGAVEPTGEAPPESEEQDEQVEIPIGMPMPENEVRRLKKAAEQHAGQDQGTPPVQADRAAEAADEGGSAQPDDDEPRESPGQGR
jgi:hypothetical protein